MKIIDSKFINNEEKMELHKSNSIAIRDNNPYFPKIYFDKIKIIKEDEKDPQNIPSESTIKRNDDYIKLKEVY